MINYPHTNRIQPRPFYYEHVAASTWISELTSRKDGRESCWVSYGSSCRSTRHSQIVTTQKMNRYEYDFTDSPFFTTGVQYPSKGDSLGHATYLICNFDETHQMN
jgi:hypothetical protein